MTGNIVARRYASALFAIGKKQGIEQLEAYGKDLAALAEALKASPALVKVFRNPIFSVDEKKAVVSKLLESVNPTDTVRNFCLLLADKDRLSAFGDIEAVFSSFLDAEKGVLRGELVTAITLDDAKQEALLSKLEAQTGRKLVLDFSANEEILGGLVLKIGDKVLDASIRAQLGMLKENIKRGE